MKITLIEPAMIKREGFAEKPMFSFQPLALGLLAGITPPDIEVEVLDDRFKSINYDAPRDMVGISVKTFSARRAYEIAAEFRKRGVTVVLGGHHPSVEPLDALANSDAVIIGEAEAVWERLLCDLGKRRLERIYQGELADGYPPGQVNRDVFRDNKYIPVTMIQTSRGCPYNCSFCSVTTVSGHAFRHRSPESIVKEIESAEKRAILFVDDNIVGDVEAAKKLFQALIPLRVQWVGQASISMARNPELMSLMQKSGCAGVLVGLESITAQSLKQIRKAWNTKQAYPESLRVAREHGIAIVGSFIIGLDHDTHESLDATLDFALEHKLFAALFNLLTPYPGTDLYRDIEAQGRLLYPKWWTDSRYTFGQVIFQPKNFSPAELAEKRMQLYRRFYGTKSILHRLLDTQANIRDPWHLLTFLALNLPAYSQELRRQAKALGGED